MRTRLDINFLAHIHNRPLEEIEKIDLEPGYRLGPKKRYSIVDFKGTGSTGGVYIIKNCKEQEEVLALKLFLPYMLTEYPERLQLIQHYFAILKAIEHPNIVKAYDLFKQRGLYFYTMEYINGVSLHACLHEYETQKRYISIADACRIIFQICSGLLQLHQHCGHYLLHPRNILLSSIDVSQCEAKISDFGTYYLQPHNFWQQQAAALNRKLYFAPQFIHSESPDLQADIFSIATILYQILTYRLPESTTSMSKIRQDVPAKLEELLGRTISATQGQKLESIEEFMLQIQEIYDNLSEPQETTDRKPVTAAPSQAPLDENAPEKVPQILSQGDALVEKGEYEEAIKTWQTCLEIATDHEEIQDRIMQVVDMRAEQAKNLLDDGNPYDAKNVLDNMLSYTEDPYIKDVAMEIDSEIQDRERYFAQTVQEGEKHFEKKQFSAAIDVWQKGVGYTKQDATLLKKISKAKQLQKTFQEDEEEYLKLTSLCRTLEQREDYHSLLQTLETIRQKQANWICPTSDIVPEIERVTKLVAAETISQEAKKILAEVNRALSNNNLLQAATLLATPIFRRQLYPSVRANYQKFCQQLQERQLSRKKMRIKIAIAVLLLATTSLILLYVFI